MRHDFAMLLSEGRERRCERARAKRNDQFAAIVHLLSLWQAAIMRAYVRGCGAI